MKNEKNPRNFSERCEEVHVSLNEKYNSMCQQLSTSYYITNKIAKKKKKK